MFLVIAVLTGHNTTLFTAREMTLSVYDVVLMAVLKVCAQLYMYVVAPAARRRLPVKI